MEQKEQMEQTPLAAQVHTQVRTQADTRPDMQQVRTRLEQDVLQVQPCTEAANRFHNSVHIAEANLRYFFPDLSIERRKALIAEVLFQQHMAMQDQGNYGLIRQSRIIDQSGIEAARPVIYCTYHLGSYRHVFHYLAQQGIDCLLFVASKTRDLQGDSFLRDSAQGSISQGWRGKLETVDAQSSSSLLAGVRALRRGKSVAIYIDGNAGVGSNKDNDSMLPVNFFGRTMMARGGVAFLGHLSGMPIVPVTCLRDSSMGLSLTLHPAIKADAGGRDAFVAQTTQALYDVLAAAMAANPAQWEGWLYVHNYLKRQAALAATAENAAPTPSLPQPNALLHADLERFALLMFGSQAVLLDKQRHSFTMLDGTTAAIFRLLAAGGQAPADIVENSASAPGWSHLMRIGAVVPGVAG